MCSIFDVYMHWVCIILIIYGFHNCKFIYTLTFICNLQINAN